MYFSDFIYVFCNITYCSLQLLEAFTGRWLQIKSNSNHIVVVEPIKGLVYIAKERLAAQLTVNKETILAGKPHMF